MNGQSTFSEMIGLFAGLDETGAVGIDEREAVLDHRQMRGMRREVRAGLFNSHDLAANQQALVSLFGDERERFRERELFTQRQVKGDQEFRAPGFGFQAERFPDE